MRQSPAGKDVNREAEESTVLGSVTKQRLEKKQQTVVVECVNQHIMFDQILIIK
jgi:hypothetical protein